MRTWSGGLENWSQTGGFVVECKFMDAFSPHGLSLPNLRQFPSISATILTKSLTDRAKNTGDFWGCK